MPFVARQRETGERIDITQVQNPRAELRSGDCVCQLCGAPLIIKAGLIRRAHFAHYAECVSDYDVPPETPEHLEAKAQLREYLEHFYADYAQATFEFEVPVPEIKRVVDLLVTFPMGWREAHEIQLSGITTEELARRSDDYLRAGIDVVWWLGRSADTTTNRQWCARRFGYSLSLTGEPAPE